MIETPLYHHATSAVIITCLDHHFARYGVPVGFKTDKGSNLVSEEMENYLEELGIVYHRNTPLWPSMALLM